ncbi:Cytochrome b561 and DOMON domain-containing protein [Abeliophyllum distichum]|uniref:Cytochrome b561 and DOMON domain-containing protein n=1 Tax=Abeliophyllum distichum TaxID=126358 RepID=A0ABD1QLE7_9LAMI
MLRAVLISCVLFSLYLSSYAQSCAKYNFASNQLFTSCNDLPRLNSFLHWNYDSSSKTVRMAYRHTGVTASKWVAWAINPKSQGMVGAQALVAFQKSDGTMRAYTAPITTYQTQLQEGDLSFPVWQDGPLSGDAPAVHPTSGPNVQSVGTLNLISGESGTTAGASNSKTKKRNIHGVLNAVSWGILMPIGALFRKLGSQSPGVQYTSHRTIGIVLFCLGTLQVFSLLLRPKKDHKYRVYWNIYHHSVGYAVIVLSIINIFKGFDILNPENKWERAYIGILVVLGIFAATLEAYTWYVVVKRKKSAASQKMANGVNGTNGHNGYGARV